MVELSEGIRKVRRVFLFHDVIVSSKQKPTRAGVKFEPKWYLPLAELSFHPPEESPEGLLLSHVINPRHACALLYLVRVHVWFVCLLFGL